MGRGYKKIPNDNTRRDDIVRLLKYLRGQSLRAVWECVQHEMSFQPRTDWKLRNYAENFKGSPVDFIKLNFGNRDRENWDPCGLSFADLKTHHNLFQAYKRWIEKHPEDKLDLPAHRHVIERGRPSLL